MRAARSILALAGCTGIFVMLSACSRDGGQPAGDPTPPKPPEKRASVSPSDLKLPDSYSTAHWPTRESAATNQWEEKFLAAKTDVERIALLDEKGASGPEFLASMIRRALRGKHSDQLMIQAVESARSLEEPDEIVDVFSAASSDANSDVAVLAMEFARDAKLEERLAIYRNSFGSPHPKIREMAVVELLRERNKSAFVSIFDGLADPDENVRKTTDVALAKVLPKQFASREEALEWWEKNSANFTDKMIFTGPLN